MQFEYPKIAFTFSFKFKNKFGIFRTKLLDTDVPKWYYLTCDTLNVGTKYGGVA